MVGRHRASSSVIGGVSVLENEVVASMDIDMVAVGIFIKAVRLEDSCRAKSDLQGMIRSRWSRCVSTTAWL